MDEIPQTAKEQIFELVSSQKKVKLEWVSTVTDIPIEKLIPIAEELGLVIDGDFISISEKQEVIPIAPREEVYSRKPSKKVKQDKIIRIVLIILAIFMILVLIPALFFGGFLLVCGWGSVVWAVFVGLIIIIGGLASCIFGIGILINQRYR